MERKICVKWTYYSWSPFNYKIPNYSIVINRMAKKIVLQFIWPFDFSFQLIEKFRKYFLQENKLFVVNKYICNEDACLIAKTNFNSSPRERMN